MSINIFETINTLKEMEGKQVTVMVASHNGRKQIRDSLNNVIGLGEINKGVSVHTGTLEVEVNEENLCHTILRVSGHEFPLLSITSEPVYQSGLAYMQDVETGACVYRNSILTELNDAYIYSASSMFDEMSLKEIYSSWKENPYYEQLPYRKR